MPVFEDLLSLKKRFFYIVAHSTWKRKYTDFVSVFTLEVFFFFDKPEMPSYFYFFFLFARYIKKEKKSFLLLNSRVVYSKQLEIASICL